jgi:hypothetical protein
MQCDFVTILEGTTKAAPLFHAGSTITMDIDLASEQGSVRFSGLAGGCVKETAIPHVPMIAFVSLYNRGAAFTLVAEAECNQR